MLQNNYLGGERVTGAGDRQGRGEKSLLWKHVAIKKKKEACPDFFVLPTPMATRVFFPFILIRTLESGFILLFISV